MELYQLRSFLAVSRIRNLTRAARQLNLSQAALSSQLKNLEEELGVTLFIRTPKGMEPTDHGRVLLTHAAEVAAAADSLLEKAGTLGGRGRATVTMGLNADPNFLRVSAISRRLAQDRPDMDVVFLTSQTVHTAEMLRQGKIDVGFMYGVPAEEDVGHVVVAHIPIVVAVPGEMAVWEEKPGWEEIARLPWIWVGSDSLFYGIMAQRLAERGLMPNRKVTTVDEQIVRELLLAGQGAAMVRRDEAAPMLAENRVVLWEEGGLTVPLVLAWLLKNGDKPAVSGVVEAVGEVWG